MRTFDVDEFGAGDTEPLKPGERVMIIGIRGSGVFRANAGLGRHWHCDLCQVGASGMDIGACHVVPCLPERGSGVETRLVLEQ